MDRKRILCASARPGMISSAGRACPNTELLAEALAKPAESNDSRSIGLSALRLGGRGYPGLDAPRLRPGLLTGGPSALEIRAPKVRQSIAQGDGSVATKPWVKIASGHQGLKARQSTGR